MVAHGSLVLEVRIVPVASRPPATARQAAKMERRLFWWRSSTFRLKIYSESSVGLQATGVGPVDTISSAIWEGVHMARRDCVGRCRFVVERGLELDVCVLPFTMSQLGGQPTSFFLVRYSYIQPSFSSSGRFCLVSLRTGFWISWETGFFKLKGSETQLDPKPTVH